MSHGFAYAPEDQIEEGASVSEKERRAASLLVCSKAENVDDARTMLAMLGLLPTTDQENT